jgi:ring-1,2-phenylacetyl-CoA epoxidase subunit PaaD
MVTAVSERALRVLADVTDPEIPVLSVLDLGIVRDVVERPDGGVEVTVTPTYSGCPATEVIVADIRAALAAAYDAVDVRVQLSPAWTTDWISEAGRAKLRDFGIAPPNGRALLPLVNDDRPDACPHCGSAAVELLAGFGSTPCKALWRCTSCREPFDYFKVH